MLAVHHVICHMSCVMSCHVMLCVDEEDEVEQSTNMRPVSRSRRHADDEHEYATHGYQHDDHTWHRRPASRAAVATHDSRRPSEHIPTIDDMRSDNESEDDERSPFEPRVYEDGATQQQHHDEQHYSTSPLPRSHSPPSISAMHAARTHSPSHPSSSTRSYSPSLSTRPYSPSVTMRPPMSHMHAEYIPSHAHAQQHAQHAEEEEDDDVSLLNDALGVYGQEKR